MQTLLPRAAQVAALLKAKQQTLGIAESSAGGLLSATLVAQAGVSAFYLGSAIVYTGQAKQALLDLPPDAPRSATEAYAALLARCVREKLGADWSLVETGASGPGGNRYGDRAGHCCLAVAGPVERVITIETNDDDRVENMRRFVREGLGLLEACVMENG
jgi:nicotinamide-nucleotide amidase